MSETTSRVIGAAALAAQQGATPGPMYHWPFDEGSGTFVTDEINGQIGNINVGTWTAGGPTGGSAIQIDGTDQSNVVFPSNVAAFGTSDFTIEFWICTSENSLPLFDLAGNRTASSGGNFVSIRMTGWSETLPAGTIVAEIDEDGNGTNYIAIQSSRAGLNDGNWHQVTLIRQQQTLSLYVDTYNVGTGTGAGIANINNGNPFVFGKSAGMSVPFSANAIYDDLWIIYSAY